MIQGVEAHGHRYTTEIPAGQIGNDKPLVRVEENWMAPSLGIQVRRISDDPQQRKTTMELVKVDLSEPPVSAFQPPEGYEVQTEELHQVACPAPGQPWH
jgi:hypothetical protein